MKDRSGLAREALITLGIMLVASSNVLAQRDARAIWKDVVKKCANNDLLGKKVLFMGPSNGVGPAAIWKKGGGGYRLVWEGSDGFSEDALARIVKVGKPASCGGRTVTQSNFDVGLILGTLIAPVAGTLGIDLKKARTITIAPETWQWDEVKTGPFEQEIASANTRYRNSASANDHYVVLRALRLSGLKATLGFDQNDAAALQAKYPTDISLGNDPASLGFTAEWKQGSNLEMTSKSDFYLVADMGKYGQSGAAGNVAKLVPVTVAQNEPTATGRER